MEDFKLTLHFSLYFEICIMIMLFYFESQKKEFLKRIHTHTHTHIHTALQSLHRKYGIF